MILSGPAENCALFTLNCLVFAGVSCLAPFLSVHMRSLGMDTILAAVCVHATSGISCCLLPLVMTTMTSGRSLLSGTTGPRWRSEFLVSQKRLIAYKWQLCASLLFAAVFYSSLLSVPRLVRVPRQPLSEFDCKVSSTADGNQVETAVFKMEKCRNFPTCKHAVKDWPERTQFTLSHCQNLCPRASVDTSRNTSYPLHICFKTLSMEMRSKEKHLCVIHHKNFGPSRLQFQALLGNWNSFEQKNVSLSEFVTLDTANSHHSIDVCSFYPERDTEALFLHGKPYDDISCRSPRTVSSCIFRCLLSISGNQPFRHRYTDLKSCHDTIGDPSKTFWTYISLRCLADGFMTSSLCLLDILDLKSTGKTISYRRVQSYAAIALVLGPPFVGAITDHYNHWSTSGLDFTPSFFIAAAFFVVACAILLIVPLKVAPENQVHSSEPDAEDQRFWWHWSEATFVTAAAVVLGSFWGFSEMFAPWILQDVGFECWMLGLSEMLCFGCSLPFVFMSSNLVQSVGDTQLVITAFAFHAIRLTGLSFFTESEKVRLWWPLPFEAMKAMTIPLAWISLCQTGKRALSSETTERRVALHCLLHILHFACGRLLGVAAFGLLGNSYGLAVAYRVAAFFAVISAAVGVALYRFYFKKLHKNRIMTMKNEQIHRFLAAGSCIELLDRWPFFNGKLMPAARGSIEDITDDDDEDNSIKE